MTTTGALGNPTTSPKARVSYTASYFDLANRLTARVDVGTNGGTAYTRPGSVPSRSDTVLVTSYAYTSAGWIDTVTDPRSLVTKTFSDALGRPTKTVEAYDGGSITNTTNKTTEYTYDGNGRTVTVQADLVGGAYEQTMFVYGVTTAGGSGVNRNDILAATLYPDPATGNASQAQRESDTVNVLGEMLTRTDRNGNVHTYVRDVLGRLISDQVTTLGSGVDGSVRRIDTAYDTQGNAYLITSYATTGTTTIVNQVQRAYNGLGQLITEYQSHSGAVNTGTTPKVQYTYSEMAGGANHSRLTSIIYPGTGTAAKTVSYTYATGLEDSISRLSSLTSSGVTLESYSYLGLGTVVQRAHAQTGIDLTYVKRTGETNGDGGDQYTGLDRFGRVVDQRWLVASSGTATDRFKYGYDRDGNRLYRTNELNHSFDELYHANGASNGYDSLNQLAAFARGTLSDTNSDGIPDTVASASTTFSWSLDAAGNFNSVTANGTVINRTHNKQNEVTQLGGTNLGFDGNGNTTSDNYGKTLVYDAWNRLVAYKNGATTLESFQYDGLNRRIVVNPDTATDLYYSSAWQVLEEQVSGVSKAQYVWSPVYVDALVLRDRDADGNSANGLEERLYVQQDANWNVTALLNTSGTVVERYAYDPYGYVAAFLNASWGTLSGSAYGWIYLHQGGRFDGISNLYYFRNRDYSPTIARWMQVDPVGYSAGDTNLYRYIGDKPTDSNDPSGLVPKLEATGSRIVEGKHGAFLWAVAWTISVPGNKNQAADSEKGGWILQHVIRSYRFTEAGKDDPLADFDYMFKDFKAYQWDWNPKTIDYWEAWRVNPGRKNASRRTDLNNKAVRQLMSATTGIAEGEIPGGIYDDLYAIKPFSVPRREKRTIHGVISFDAFAEYIDCADKLPSGFKPGKLGTDPGGTLQQMPTLLDDNNSFINWLVDHDKSKTISNRVEHSVSVEWTEGMNDSTTQVVSQKLK